MNMRPILSAIAIVTLLLAGVWLWRSSGTSSGQAGVEEGGVVQDDSGRRVLYWYDPMAPQHRFDKPGKSPFMDMQLVPKYADEASDTSVQVAPTVQQSLGIRIEPVERTPFGESVTAAGRIEVNERELHAVPSRVSGYVERLLVRAIGDPVAAGAKLAEIYSPELLSAQREFLVLRGAQTLSGSDALIDASRRRLRLLGMADHEIEAIARGGEASSRFGVYAPASGFVIDLAIREGGQIEAGATLMSIANLSTLWLIAEVPEREASRIEHGDRIEARLEGAASERFTGTVDFVYPTLNAEARTARVRIVIPNDENHLRPGMFATVSVRSAEREALSVPSEAVITTGIRSVVIVKEPSGFRPAEVRVGAERGGRTEILSGLSEGERVVASGQFLIDSEASLSGVLARLSHEQKEQQPHDHDAVPEPADHSQHEPEADPQHDHSHDHGDHAEAQR